MPADFVASQVKSVLLDIGADVVSYTNASVGCVLAELVSRL